MAMCEVCGNDYDKAFQVVAAGHSHIFDSFECAIQAMAPRCDHCGVAIIGHGSEADGNISRLVRYLARWPVLFIPGPGTFLLQPVFVDDVAGAIVDAYRSPLAVKKCYNIAGRRPLTFNALVDMISSLLKRKTIKIHLPLWPLVMACRWAETMGMPFFVRSDQLRRLNEDKNFDYHEAATDFGFSPVAFETGIRRAIESMGPGL